MSKGLHFDKEILVYYLPVCFFYNLAKLIIFTMSSSISSIFFLNGDSRTFI